MTLELSCLAWLVVLAVVQIMMAGQARTKQYGTQWNVSARDGEMPELNPLAARLARAQANLFETLPLFAIAILIATVANKTNWMTEVGAVTYLIARLVYLPLYAFGVPVVRTVVWMISMLGFLLVLAALAL
ncbi:MAPEG family protein [Methyloradius palustris]|uniref:Membrane protein n=1 Tax=Methyloradius palustris TaxID=2778876 RepID=A0A8D5GDD5_9PROT|nr:MAPEG family protein [Methyloradius palustris]BCM24549.1 membrane protein [Methyloradius palustris]